MTGVGRDERTDPARWIGAPGVERRTGEEQHRDDPTGGFERLLHEDGRTIQRGLD